MKKIAILFSIVLVMSLVFSSCAGKKKCPAYSKNTQTEQKAKS